MRGCERTSPSQKIECAERLLAKVSPLRRGALQAHEQRRVQVPRVRALGRSSSRQHARVHGRSFYDDDHFKHCNAVLSATSLVRYPWTKESPSSPA